MTIWIALAILLCVLTFQSFAPALALPVWFAVQFYWRWRIEKKLGQTDPFAFFLN
ncbi:MAG TPA: hypothetical protein VHL34_17180 [Rhizomicrobium sp.]|jgi:hypothetical protein|nr:hypothetical protein [Rhizomicrobium sp.]